LLSRGEEDGAGKHGIAEGAQGLADEIEARKAEALASL
jgi:hypothetical protein